MRTLLANSISIWKERGPVKKLRPVLPSVPGSGIEKIPRVLLVASNPSPRWLGSKKKIVPLSGSNKTFPISGVQPLQSANDWLALLSVAAPE
jgi:hypothetical protein